MTNRPEAPRPECPLVEERLPALLENALPPGETVLVRAHLDGCDRCAAELDGYSTLIGDVRATRETDGFDAARAALTSALDAAPPAPVVRRLSTGRARALAAAAAVVVFGGLLVLEPPLPTSDTLRVASAAIARPFDAVLDGLGRADLTAGLLPEGDSE